MTREEGKEFANALKNNYTIDFDKLPEFCDLVISALSENKGEWIAQDIHDCCTKFKCSKCGYTHVFMHLYDKPTADYTYCPNCGADMRGE